MTKRKPPPEFVVPTTITVADESAIVAMIEHPAEPTQALVELMAEVVPSRDVDVVGAYLAQYEVEKSRDTMMQALRSALAVLLGKPTKGDGRPDDHEVRVFPWHTIDHDVYNVLRARLAAQCALATANLRLTAVRGVLRVCRRKRLIDAETMADIDDVKPIKGSSDVAGQYLSAEVRARLDAACGSDACGARDRAMLAVLYGTGARRDEISRLDVAHWNRVEGTLRLRGKGNKPRVVPVSDELADVLAEVCGARASGPIFCSAHRNREMQYVERLTGTGIYDAVKRVAEAAGVDAIGPHDFRRTFVSDMIDLGVDMKTISDLVGHANTNTTSKYDRRGQRAGRAAVNRLVLRGAGK